jgi:hypothetical protein
MVSGCNSFDCGDETRGARVLRVIVLTETAGIICRDRRWVVPKLLNNLLEMEMDILIITSVRGQLCQYEVSRLTGSFSWVESFWRTDSF